MVVDVISYRRDGSIIGNVIDKLCPCGNEYKGYKYSERCRECYEVELKEFEAKQRVKYLHKDDNLKYSHKIGDTIKTEHYGELIVSTQEYGCNGCHVHDLHILNVKEKGYDLFHMPKFCEDCENVIFKKEVTK